VWGRPRPRQSNVIFAIPRSLGTGLAPRLRSASLCGLGVLCVEKAVIAYSSGISAPGFKMPCGSSARFTARITSNPSPCSAAIQRMRMRPIP